MGSGGAGFTVGTRTQKIDNQSVRHSASASTVGSTSGDVLVVAAKDFRQTGSDILAPQGSIDIAAQRVDIKEARNTVESTTRTSFKQTGVSVAVSSPVITAVQTAQQMVTAAAATKDSRMQALAVANVGMAGMAAYDAVQAGQGTTINGKDNQIATGTDADGKPTSRDSTAADKVGGFTVSISLGTSKSSSKTDYASSTAVASHVNAGGDVRMTAAGAGTESDLRLEGSTIKAGHAVTLQADDAITLQAAGNTDAQHSKNKSSNASIGVAISSDGGIGVTASGGLGRGHADGSDLSWRNTHIEASQVAMTSGGDMTLRGAVAKAAQVSATVGGNLQIESLQDTTHFDSRQKSVSGGVMIGTTVTGNATYAQSQIDSDYASVVEQTSIRAGDGGFHVEVAGDATLRGGAITGTHLAVEQGRNSFTTAGTLALTDIENRAQYKATAVSVSVGTGVNPAGKLTPAGSSIGLGNDSDRDASTTQAAISAIAGNRDARTGDKETGIAQIFDAGTVQKDIDAQVQITQIFGQQVSKVIGDYASTKQAEANALRAQAATTDDIDRRQQLLQQATDLDNTWGDTGSARVLAHVVAGGLTAGFGGAAGAAAGALSAPYIADQLAKAGVDEALAKTITTVVSTTAGALAGGTAGASTAFNEVTNNYLSHQEANRYEALQLKKVRGQCDTACESEIKALAATDKQRDTQLAGCEGIESSACSTIRQDVRHTAAGYVRADQLAGPYSEYSQQRAKTAQLAQQTMDGVRLATLNGYGQSVADGAVVLVNGMMTGLQALFGDPQARAQVAEGAQKATAYVSDPQNWRYLLGAMTPETREQLAAAYERGDGKEVGRLMGAQFASLPIPVVGLGTVKKVGQGVSVIEDVEKVSVKIGTKPDATDSFIGVNGANKTVTYPEGLAYRTDLPNHLFGPDGFTKSGQLSGTHNLNNATSALDRIGVSYKLNPTSTPGISELSYKYTSPANDKPVIASKTVYDPALYSDKMMLDLSQKAGKIGFENYLQNSTQKIFDVNQGGINFRTYINIDPKTGIPFVGNVHPIK